MPLIPTHWRECVFYVYDSPEAAKSSKRAGGGTGFFVSKKTETLPDTHTFRYAVTNWHVIKDLKNPVLRINVRDGGFDILKTDRRSWFKHPNISPDGETYSDEEDVAVLALRPDEEYAIRPMDFEEWFMTKEDLGKYGYGPGDEVVMLGRLIAQSGIAQNYPVARFGHISRNPIHEKPLFLIEMQSIGGHSGSPVFAIPIPLVMPGAGRNLPAPQKLLGIDRAHIPLEEPLLVKSDGEWKESRDLRVRTNSSVCAVVPAWKIAEVLNMDKLNKIRKSAEKAQASLEKLLKDMPDSEPSETREFTKEYFEDALTKVSRKTEK